MLKYPKKPKDIWDSVKITQKEHENILRMYKNGLSMSYLADKYHVHRCTIRYHVDDEYRERVIKSSNEKVRRKLADPIEKQKILERAKIIHRKQLNDPKWVAWKKSYTNYRRLPYIEQKAWFEGKDNEYKEKFRIRRNIRQSKYYKDLRNFRLFWSNCVP